VDKRAIRSAIALAYMRDLKRAGIEASVRAVDAGQFDHAG